MRPDNSIRTLPIVLILILALLRIVWIGLNPLLGEEAYYWNYAMHLDYGYLDHPPLLALLIKLSTMFLGNHEFAIRLPSGLCWVGMAYFSYQWSELVKQGSGLYALLVVSSLPFFFSESLFMTPDMPLLFAWSATLYALYRAIILEQTRFFYVAGLSLGLGLLCKYSIALLVLTTGVFITMVPEYRIWWRRKELYLSALLALLIFSPVIYWNATHEWASFAFQSTRRLHELPRFTFHIFIGLFLLFLLPVGVWGFVQLFQSFKHEKVQISIKTRRFIQIYTVVPLWVFACFSLRHLIKFNWIGPSLLALVPWLAALMDASILTKTSLYYRRFMESASILTLGYALIVGMILTVAPTWVYKNIFPALIDWQGTTLHLHEIAKQVEQETGQEPIFLTLDYYKLASELDFYQSKAVSQQLIDKKYPVLGRSLMYAYWDKISNHHGNLAMIIALQEQELRDNARKISHPRSTIKTLCTLDPKHKISLAPLYYQLVELK